MVGDQASAGACPHVARRMAAGARGGPPGQPVLDPLEAIGLAEQLEEALQPVVPLPRRRLADHRVDRGAHRDRREWRRPARSRGQSGRGPRDRAPAAAAPDRRHDRGRFRRPAGAGGAGAPARSLACCPCRRPRAGPGVCDVALRPGRDQPQAGRAEPRRDAWPRVPAVRRRRHRRRLALARPAADAGAGAAVAGAARRPRRARSARLSERRRQRRLAGLCRSPGRRPRCSRSTAPSPRAAIGSRSRRGERRHW